MKIVVCGKHVITGTCHSLTQKTVPAFGNPGRSIVKTGVMMIGEFDFDDLFNSPDVTVPGVTWFIFVVFVIVMTLILMNLLVRFLGLCEYFSR